MDPGIFSTKCHGLPKSKWALDLFSRWPHYKMTYKTTFCSGLEAINSAWEIARGIFWNISSHLNPYLHLLCCGYQKKHRNSSPRCPISSSCHRAKRSMPQPQPPVGGRPCSSAITKPWSTFCASCARIPPGWKLGDGNDHSIPHWGWTCGIHWRIKN